MIDSSNSIENSELLQALEKLHRENTPENQNKALEIIVEHARFLAPIVLAPNSNERKITQFQLITSHDGRTFLPAFTDGEQLSKLCGSKDQHVLILSFDDYASLLAVKSSSKAAGFVINPLDAHPLTLEREFVSSLAERKKVKIGYSPKSVQKGSAILFSEAKNCPQILLDQVCLAVTPLEEVQRLYLCLMTQPDIRQSSYLIIVEHSGDQDTLFRTIAKAARPHLGEHQVSLVSFDSELGKTAAQDVTPFFDRRD